MIFLLLTPYLKAADYFKAVWLKRFRLNGGCIQYKTSVHAPWGLTWERTVGISILYITSVL